MTIFSELGAIMGQSGLAGDRVALAFNLLLPALCDREDPHEWDVRPVPNVRSADGQPKLIKLFPESFARRLVAAHAAGAFERMTPADIADRILSTDEPAEDAA